MTVYRFGWDMNSPGERRQAVVEYITGTFAYCKIAETDWLIETSIADANTLWSKHFARFFDINDSALLIQCAPNYQGLLPQDRWNWLKNAKY